MAADDRTIRLKDDVYERLKAEKRDDESFSEAVERLLSGTSVLDLYGLREDEGTERIRTEIEAAKERSRREVEALQTRAQGDE